MAIRTYISLARGLKQVHNKPTSVTGLLTCPGADRASIRLRRMCSIGHISSPDVCSNLISTFLTRPRLSIGFQSTAYTGRLISNAVAGTPPRRLHVTSTNTTSAPPAGRKSKPPRPRTKNPTALTAKDQSQWLSTAYSTSEEYQLEHLSLDLQTHPEFKVASMPKDAHDVLHMNVVPPEEQEEISEMFIFRNGCLVFWNVPEMIIKKVLKIASNHQSEPYEVALINWENEQMNYSYHNGVSSLKQGCIVLDAGADPCVRTLEKFAFSNAMVLSVKLAMWEYMLDKFVFSIEHIPQTLKKSGKLRMSHSTTIKHIGELYSLRHRINLSSDLLAVPDFYWDREDLETLFTKTCNFFSIDRRTRVMNDKLNHCNDLMQLMRNDVADQHSLRLEVMITLLIGVEIIIELSHYAG